MNQQNRGRRGLPGLSAETRAHGRRRSARCRGDDEAAGRQPGQRAGQADRRSAGLSWQSTNRQYPEGLVMDEIQDALDSIEWDYADDDPAVIAEFARRIRDAVREGKQKLTYSELAVGVTFHL